MAVLRLLARPRRQGVARRGNARRPSARVAALVRGWVGPRSCRPGPRYTRPCVRPMSCFLFPSLWALVTGRLRWQRAIIVIAIGICVE